MLEYGTEEQKTVSSEEVKSTHDECIRRVEQAIIILGCMIPALELIRQEGYRAEHIDVLHELIEMVSNLPVLVSGMNKEQLIATVLDMDKTINNKLGNKDVGF